MSSSTSFAKDSINMLLVDFPFRPRSKKMKSNNSNERNNNYKHRAAVRFSETSLVISYPQDVVDQSKIWYTDEDKASMNHQFVASVLHTREMLTQVDRLISPHEQLCRCVGIEHLLSSGMARRRRHRREHVTSIVSRQDTCTSEELRSRSKHSSRLARYNAHCMAVSNIKIG